jgi:hypothetical protein
LEYDDARHGFRLSDETYTLPPVRISRKAVLGDRLPAVLTGGKPEIGGRKSEGGDDVTVEELAAKVAGKSATDEERKRLGGIIEMNRTPFSPIKAKDVRAARKPFSPRPP